MYVIFSSSAGHFHSIEQSRVEHRVDEGKFEVDRGMVFEGEVSGNWKVTCKGNMVRLRSAGESFGVDVQRATRPGSSWRLTCDVVCLYVRK